MSNARFNEPYGSQDQASSAAMQLLPHIDVTGDARIDAILRQSGIYRFEAVTCEALDGWVPDFGLTNYPVESIYRPPSVASAGMPSTLRHRFWSTMDGATDHTGRKYIGVVLYDAAGEACPLEFRLGADDIGRIEPARHDNRRHLVIIDRPVQFRGEMEVFQVRAPGAGTYRIETFALLPDRPEPSDVTPRIERLSTRITKRTASDVVAEVHFTTSDVTHCHVEAWPNDGDDGARRTAEGDRPGQLHAIKLPGLAPERHYTLRVTATGPLSATATTTTEVFTGQERASGGSAVTVPVELINPDPESSRTKGLPLTFGVPLPPGRVLEADRCQVRTGERGQTAQVRIHSRWPDGSARWALIDTPCPVDLPPSSATSSEVKFTTDAATSPPEPGLNWNLTDGRAVVIGQHLRVTVDAGGSALPALIERHSDDGGWRTVLGGGTAGAGLAVVLGNGLRLDAGPIEDVTLEEAGRERTVIRYHVRHRDRAGTTHLRSTVRLHIFGRHPFVTLSHRLEVISPVLTPATDEPPRSAPVTVEPEIQSAIAGTDGEQHTLLTVRSVTLDLPFGAIDHAHAAGEERTVTEDQAWRVVHEHELAYRHEAEGRVNTIAGRHPGRVLVAGDAGRLMVQVRHFWETYPNALRVQPDGVTVELLPPLAGDPPPGDEEAWHRLYFWREGTAYKVKVGMALQRDLLLVFPTAEEDDTHLDQIDAWFRRPPLVRPNLAWLNDTGALSPIASKAGSPLPRYETMVDDAVAGWLADRQQTRAYGFLNFGDWYGESAWSWGNNEYDAPFAHYLEFLRGGDPAWFALAGQAARHIADVDTCNESPDPALQGGQYLHMPGHAGGYLPPYFRSKIPGSRSVPSHMWIEGPVLHYVLTGDESVRETLDRTGAWLIRGMGPAGLDYYDFHNLREAGWHLTHLCGMARLSDDPRYLNAAALIVERVLERQGENGGWDHLLTLSHCSCPPPRHRGEAGFMGGILLSGLRRFHELTDDPRVAVCIVRGAHWLIASTYDEERGLFRYTTCPRKRQPDPEYTVPVLDGLAYANLLVPDRTLSAIVERGFADLGLMRSRLGHLGFGKALCWQTRFVPTVLATWSRRAT